MTDPPGNLSDSELSALTEALRSGRVRPPYTEVSLQRVLAQQHAASTVRWLMSLQAVGANPEAIAAMLGALAADRRNRPPFEDGIDLVTTGPEASGVTNRDTSVVVRELFANARCSVLVVGYAVYQGQRVFQALADRMATRAELKVRLFLDIQRSPADTSSVSAVVRRFADRFVSRQWPTGRPLPTVYYYPAALGLDRSKRASLHAKCVVVDHELLFVSSANFTEAAQERNIEVGVLIRSSLLAARVTRHFDSLLQEGLVVPLDLRFAGT